MIRKLFRGDCLDILRTLEPDSLDSLVTDPPAGISFMGKEWDDDKGGRDAWVAWLTEVMRECHRVLKPGAHGLVWALPRTSHWTATALENAGFEIRDVVTHLFGTGFPKSMDISKAIDKAAGAARPIVGKRDRLDQSSKPCHRNGYSGPMRNQVDALDITAPATEAAKQWSGYGTDLKPASEHWILVRKPLGEKTVAANVLKHGTGGINVDGCRIPGHNPSLDRRETARKTGTTPGRPGEYGDTITNRISPEAYVADRPGEHLGRFPANLVLSHNDDCSDTCSEGCAVRMLDEQSGILRPGERPAKRAGMGYHGGDGTKGERVVLDSGGASRFFYVAKASKQDRNRKAKDGQQAPDGEEHESDGLFDPAGNPTRGDRS